MGYEINNKKTFCKSRSFTPNDMINQKKGRKINFFLYSSQHTTSPDQHTDRNKERINCFHHIEQNKNSSKYQCTSINQKILLPQAHNTLP